MSDLVSFSPVFQLAFFAKGQQEFKIEPSNMLTQPDN